MKFARKMMLALAAGSMATYPAVGHAMAGARAVSSVSSASELEGNASWIIGLVGLLAGIGAMIIIASDDDDAPVSP